jgi:prepilin-type N-terminal cleavage/methylation domain-containing protein
MNTHIEEVAPAAKKDKGFTLVELLIVIVILGILSTVTVFAVRGITNKGQESACGADKATYSTAIESYFSQYGTSTIATGQYGAGATATQAPVGTDMFGAIIGSKAGTVAAPTDLAATAVALTTTLDSVGRKSQVTAIARPVTMPASVAVGATPMETLVNAGLLRKPSKAPAFFVHSDGTLWNVSTVCGGVIGAAA